MRVLRSLLTVAVVALAAGCGSTGSNASTFEANPSPLASVLLTFPPKSHASGSISGITLSGTRLSTFYVLPEVQGGGVIVDGPPSSITVVSSDPSKLTVAAGGQYGTFLLKAQMKSGAATAANLTIHVDALPHTTRALTVVVPVKLLGG
jgi:hypothetical protein